MILEEPSPAQGAIQSHAEMPAGTTIVIEPTKGWASLQLRDVWQYRELLYFLAWRDIKVRYKQTALGVLWIVLQPVISILVFSFLFGTLLNVPSGDIPYPIFSFAALLPWNYFAAALNRATTSLVGSAALITKVYFPRLVIPFSGVLSGLVDFGVAFLVLIGLMVYYGVPLRLDIVFLPLFILLAVLTALGFSLWLSALNVRYRDINYVAPFLIQIWMYLTPVVYGNALIPERFRFLLWINPMTGVVEGFRWALLGLQPADLGTARPYFLLSVAITLVVLVTGAIFFRRTERTFADIV